jgi:hypothetical protein
MSHLDGNYPGSRKFSAYFYGYKSNNHILRRSSCVKKLIKFFNHIHRLLCCCPLDKRSLPAFLARSLIALDHLIRYNVSEDLIDEWCDFLGSVKAVFISLVGGSGTFVFLDG